LIERQLTNLPLPSAPASLRSAVLKEVRRNLKAQRWDRRLARAAVALLAVWDRANAAVGWRGGQRAANPTLAGIPAGRDRTRCRAHASDRRGTGGNSPDI